MWPECATPSMKFVRCHQKIGVLCAVLCRPEPPTPDGRTAEKNPCAVLGLHFITWEIFSIMSSQNRGGPTHAGGGSDMEGCCDRSHGG